MASSNHKNHVSQELDKKHKRILAQCVKEEGNRNCADCGCRGPTWASVNLGVFVCLTCSGIHRSLGVHISQVRSTTLDTWLPKQVTFVTMMGNQKANRYWERRLPAGFTKPVDGQALKAFIRNKYVDKLYVPHDMPPPDNQNYQSHPYCMDEKTPVAETVQPSPKKNKSAPQLQTAAEVPLVSLEAGRKTPLVVQSTDFLSLGDDVQSNQSAPHSVGTSDWEPFAGGSPVKEHRVEKSAGSWNAFESAPQPPKTVTPSPDLLGSQTASTAPSPDPFGLDGLQQTPKAETTVTAFTSQDQASFGMVPNGQQSTEDILKLYDIPKKTGEPLLPPNLGLPMGPPQGAPPPSLYPPVPPAPAAFQQQFGGFQPQMANGHLYPQIAVPNMQQSYGHVAGQGAAYFNPAGVYPPHSFYGPGRN